MQEETTLFTSDGTVQDVQQSNNERNYKFDVILTVHRR